MIARMANGTAETSSSSIRDDVPGSSRAANAVRFWPVFAWLTLQMLALLAAVFRVPFSARFPALGEQLAIHEMLVVQMAASALLFPCLFRTWATGVVVIAATPVMVQLAGVLAAAQFEPLVAVCSYATLWVIGLGLWAAALRTAKGRMYGIAVASVLTIGGAMLTYLARESVAPGTSFNWAAHGWFGPLTGAVTLLEEGERTGTAWGFMGCVEMSGLGAAGVGWQRSRRVYLGGKKQ
jgi:hypothetical protein